jgi:hypothetical protein
MLAAADWIAFAPLQLPFSAAVRAPPAAPTFAAATHCAFFPASLQRPSADAAAEMFPARAALMHASQPSPPPAGLAVEVDAPVAVPVGRGVVDPPVLFGEVAVGALVPDGSAVWSGRGSVVGAVASGAKSVVAPEAAGVDVGMGSGWGSSVGLTCRAATMAMAASSTAPTAPRPMTSPLPPP